MTEVDRFEKCVASWLARINLSQLPVVPIGVELVAIGTDSVLRKATTVQPGLILHDGLVGEMPVVRLTFQKLEDFERIESTSLRIASVLGAGRATMEGASENVFALFSNAYEPTDSNRCPFRDFVETLVRSKDLSGAALENEIANFGPERLVDEGACLFADAADLVGLPDEFSTLSILFDVQGIRRRIALRHEGGWHISADSKEDSDVTLRIPEITTIIDRLLGRLDDMDAILTRKLVVTGPAVDEAMPLFEQISVAITHFTHGR